VWDRCYSPSLSRAASHRLGRSGTNELERDANPVEPSTWKRAGTYVRPRRWLVVGVALLSLVSGFAEAALLYVLLRSATALAAEEKTIPVDFGPIELPAVEIDDMVLLGVAILAGLAALAVARAAATATLTNASLNEGRKQLFRAFVRTTFAMQSSLPEGHMQAVLGGHVQRIGTSMLNVATAVTAAFSFASLMVAALVLDPISALIVLAAVAGCGMVLLPLTRLSKRWAKEAMHQSNLYNSLVAQSVRVISEVRVFGVGDALVRVLDRASDLSEQLGYRSRVLTRLTPQLYQYAALLLLLLGIGAAANFDGADLADLGVVVVLMVRALSYGQQVSGAVQQLADSAPFLDEIEELRTVFESNHMRGGPERLHAIESIEARGVTFSYTPGVPVLRDVTFSVDRGECIGIVGPSGGGKSTLVHILLRLREPDAGTYLVNGVPANRYDLDDFYGHVALVPQDNVLISDTVAENIRFYNDSISEEAVERAARLAHLHDEILKLPDGYDTWLGIGFQDLSGGQRQRLGLARALATSPSVLILDEPTAALDARSERLVQQTLDDLKGDVTVIVVAHRLSTLQRCDKILVLEQGCVTAFGDHDEVLRDSLFFREASRLQLRV
jgi:ABC-type multidrug transport system fused ATPase/permease subunit